MYENLFEKTLTSEQVYEGKIVNIRMDSVELVNGKTSFREVVEHAGGVVILAVDDNNRAYMVRQFRYPIGRAMLEVPAGKLEKGEDPLEGAIRELREETGLTAEKLIYFGGTYPSPGFCDEQLHIYLALGLTHGEACPDEDEFLNLEVVDLDELVQMVMSGKLLDGKSINAIFMAREYLRNHQD
ncbi:MAG: NUDIX hydrolase [Oscillospiraceae bacterium]|nr:NUDIX hydrolase [Oscillospiraceae bacterium]